MTDESYLSKILVPVDGSHTCLYAEEVAVFIAKKFESKVIAIHVIPSDLLHAWSGLHYQLPLSVHAEIRDSFLQKGNKIIQDVEALYKEEKIEVDARLIQFDDPAETILRIAKTEECGLIIIGNRGGTEIEVYSLGSTAEKIVRHAEHPILIVKEKTKLSKILVGIDGSEYAEKALHYAMQLADKLRGELTLINVQESDLFHIIPQITREVGQRILSNTTSKFKGTTFNTRLEFGNPAEIIIETAETESYDLIVVGSRGLGRIKRFFLGSVSDDISHHAKTSVLIVR